MRYWDSSALVSLLVQEPETAKREKQLRADAEIVTWWATRVECASALNRLARGGRLTQAQLKLALGDLDELAEGWAEVQPSDRVRLRAQRLLRVHPLRAADALQLSACLVAFDGESPCAAFVCADERLGEAAEKEGLRVLT